MRRIGVGNFRNTTEAGVIQIFQQRPNKARRGFTFRSTQSPCMRNHSSTKGAISQTVP
jgi:hypothetical protein